MTLHPFPTEPRAAFAGLTLVDAAPGRTAPGPAAAALVEAARAGRMALVVDDVPLGAAHGFLSIPAEAADAAAINFMARHARGLVCLALDGAIVDRLGLALMPRRNRPRHGAAFTVSIEARAGVATGISAADRARTIAAAAAADAAPGDVVSPGHVFPIRGAEGGLRARPGRAEAAIALSRLAGRRPAAVICEIMNDAGALAQGAELDALARRHGLAIGGILELAAHPDA